MRITNTDIDALIDVSLVLRNLADMQVLQSEQAKFRGMCYHVRKIYILLLKASSHKAIDLHQLIFEGIMDDPALDYAIKSLFPEGDTDT